MFKCLDPLRFLSNDGSFYHVVSCGKCYPCMQKKRAEWDLRLIVESYYSVQSAFITLTYDDDHLDQAHNYRNIQLMHKRMRNDGIDFKFYHVSEFGSKNGRPHNHELIFFKNDFDPRSLYSYFTFGFMDVGTLTPSSVHYVTKWHVHPKYRVGESVEQHGFTRQSVGLGSQLCFTENNISPFYSFNGNSYPVSRYYRKKCGISLSDYNRVSLYDYFRDKYHLSHSDIVRLIKEQFLNSISQKSLSYGNL